jgi:hypothetical protein
VSVSAELIPFVSPWINQNAVKDLLDTLDEAKRGEVTGLTIIISRPSSQMQIRRSWICRMEHAGAIAQALHDICAYIGDSSDQKDPAP